MAVEIANSKKQIDFHTIDTWEGSKENQDDYYVKNGSLYEKFITNIKPVQNYIKVIKSDSVKASFSYEDNSIDFLFIDGSHEYEDVKKDLVAWFPKIKQGGLIAGHDYTDDWKSVKNAVDEFGFENNLKVLPISVGSWAIKKIELWKKLK